MNEMKAKFLNEFVGSQNDGNYRQICDRVQRDLGPQNGSDRTHDLGDRQSHCLILHHTESQERPMVGIDAFIYSSNEMKSYNTTSDQYTLCIG